MKKVLGLDLGTNSIGWAVVSAEQIDENLESKGIEMAGSRIIPMDAAILGDFEKGNSVSQTAERTRCRGIRRLFERNALRRERLNRVLAIMGFLPEHYAMSLNRYGQFLDHQEPKVAWRQSTNNRFEFIFMDSFLEMVEEFKKHQPQLFHTKTNGQETRIPYDWTIYYLRKKALTQNISKQELAWILLNFNQKRGYYQRAEDDAQDNSKSVEYCALKVVSVEDSGEKKGADTWYNVHLENGWIYRRTSRIELDWVGKTKEFIVTTQLDEDGLPKLDKEGNVKRSFRSPMDDDWALVKKRTEYDIDKTSKTIGEYIFDTLLYKPDQKIRGRLIRTIERRYYKTELIKILETQKMFHPELQDAELYQECIKSLYNSNEDHRNNISNKDFIYLFIDDIIFYHRPLKSKKSLIANCAYESRVDNEGRVIPVKAIAKSNPLYQEFRLWQFVSNLRIYERSKVVSGKLETDVDVTSEFLGTEDSYVNLYEWLDDREKIDQNTLLGKYFKIMKPKGKEMPYPYRWNYVEDKSYPCNETKANIVKYLSKANIDAKALSANQLNILWHILFSISDKNELEKALTTYASKNGLGEEFVAIFRNFPSHKRDYGTYSYKAISKLLPLMRTGKYWSEEAIDPQTKSRINNLISGVFDPSIKDRVRMNAINLSEIRDFRNLPLWLACYVVYDRHSEAKDLTKWETWSDIDNYLATFKQHSLRNPIVEQVITETLRTVRDIWKAVGKIDEIHIELGRDMKNTKDNRTRLTKQNSEKENTNLRIKAMLMEFCNPQYGIQSVRPYSPNQQEILRIYEEYAISNISDDDSERDFVSKISKQALPTKSDICRYKLWLEQKYRSPYTGEIIPLSKLFTSDYEIEHVIPRSIYFDDSFSNKVICESEVNKIKGNMLGYEFIMRNEGRKIELNYGHVVEVFSLEEYERFVKKHYLEIPKKMKKLLLEDIPDDFIERQKIDSSYISKIVKILLSNIVRVDGEQEAISKNVITCTGAITDMLKKEWGVNDVWNRIVLPRFVRMNELIPNESFVEKNSEGHLIPSMPFDRQKGFNKKRIDHRHHAMDAIVIACTTRSHVNLLNNESAKSGNAAMRNTLSRKLRHYQMVRYEKDGIVVEREVPKAFIKPWDTFNSDVYSSLNNIVVSFKQNLRVVNKTVNYYQKYENGEKRYVEQEGTLWAIRKPMHKETYLGEVNLRFIKSAKLAIAFANPAVVVDSNLKKQLTSFRNQGLTLTEVRKYFEKEKDMWADVNLSKIDIYYFTKDTNDRYYASRKDIVSIFADEKGKIKDFDKCIKVIESITDQGIQKILKRHLENKNNDPEIAFSIDGIDDMNCNIVALNGNKAHKPITKVRTFEKADKFAVGQVGNKSSKFVEAAKGTNLFYAVYINKVKTDNEGGVMLKRNYVSIPLNEIIERKINNQPIAQSNDHNGKLLFVLSPGDLVYLPKNEQIGKTLSIDSIDKSRIYKFVSCTGDNSFYIPSTIAFPLVKDIELGSNNKSQRAWTGEMIKEICIPIKVDKIGNITLI